MSNLKDVLIEYKQHNIKVRKSTHASLYNNILEYTNFLKSSAKIKERIYVILQDITNLPSCICGNALDFMGPSTGYRQFCSVSCSANNSEVQQKKQNTCLKNHGVTSPAKSENIRNKMWSTTEKRLGVLHSQQSNIVRDKTKTTNLKKYGAEAFTNTSKFKYETQETYKRRYQNRAPKQLHIPQISWKILNNKDDLVNMNETKTLLEIADYLEVSISLISRYFKKYNIPVKHHFNNSKPEQELKDFILSITKQCTFNNRLIISPKELDIVLPDHNIAIEFCGLYWHSDLHDRIDQYYHINKTISCKKLGLQLLTFFEDEWYEKRNIIENIIKYKLTLLPKIYARKCKVIQIHKNTKKEFFEKYHIQGNGRGSIHYGLQYDNELVACMTFINHKNGIYELNRFASKNVIVGGFSKILQYFKKTNEWAKIISYADKRFSVGNIYKTNGFILTSDSKPAYSYVKQKTRYHRRMFMKKVLPKIIQNFDPDLSERENMENNNIHRIWDCGQLKFELNNNRQNE